MKPTRFIGECTLGYRGSEALVASAGWICGQWGERKDNLKLWRGRSPKTAVGGSDWSQLGHRVQLDCSIDWPLVSGMKKTCWHCCYVTNLQSQVVLRGGLTPTGFRFLMFVNYSGATESSLSGATREIDKTTTLTTQRKQFLSSLNVSISPPAVCWFGKIDWTHNWSISMGSKISEGSERRRKRMGKQLVGYTIAEIKSRIPA